MNKELKQEIECPFHEEKAKAALSTDTTTLKYHGVNYDVISYFYKCPVCKAEFTTNESDDETLKQIPPFFEKHYKNETKN